MISAIAWASQDARPLIASCSLSPHGEGLALRGVFLLLLFPLVIWAIWKKRRR